MVAGVGLCMAVFLPPVWGYEYCTGDVTYVPGEVELVCIVNGARWGFCDGSDDSAGKACGPDLNGDRTIDGICQDYLKCLAPKTVACSLMGTTRLCGFHDAFTTCNSNTSSCAYHCVPECGGKCGGVPDTCGSTCDATCPVPRPRLPAYSYVPIARSAAITRSLWAGVPTEMRMQFSSPAF